MKANSDAVIVLDSVCFQVEDSTILDQVSFQVKFGEVFGVMGMSGVGKSTLLRLLMGLIRPQAGAIWVLNQPIHALREAQLNEVRKMMGMCFQGAALFDSMTVGDNLAFGLRRFHPELGEEEIRRRVDDHLAIVGLQGQRDRFPAQLSGGMRKRVGIARALMTEPAIMLYDEPTAGLDPIMSGVILELIRRVCDEFSTTSVVVTHEVDELFQIADRVIMLHQGRILAEDTPEQLRCCSLPEVKQFVEGLPAGPIRV